LYILITETRVQRTFKTAQTQVWTKDAMLVWLAVQDFSEKNSNLVFSMFGSTCLRASWNRRNGLVKYSTHNWMLSVQIYF
jgi:hypothetical protein